MPPRDAVPGPAGVILLAVVVLGAAGAAVLVARPWLAPWGLVFLFGTTAELRLRVSEVLGVSKDAYVGLLLGVAVLAVLRGRSSFVGRLPPVTVWAPLAALLVLYALDLGGAHGASWVFGTRLLVEPVLLLLIGLTSVHPGATLRHLVAAMTVFMPLQAVLAWVQQAAGADALVYSWGYEYGSQVRPTSDGGLRTSGSFEEPFALAAQAVLAACVALTVATRRQAAVLWLSVVAVLGATQVRTALLQLGVLGLLLLLRRGQVQAAAVSVVALGAAAVLVGGLFLTSSTVPGGPERPLLLTLNGRFDAWAVAYEGPATLAQGNGVGAVGAGSTRADGGLVASAPAYDPNQESRPRFAGDPAFIDSSWGQVLSDVGLAGVVLLVLWVAAYACWLRPYAHRGTPAAWLALALIAVSVLDWFSRTTLASYPTGFSTFYYLGIATAAAVVRAPSRVGVVEGASA